jgi:hypothetical protein
MKTFLERQHRQRNRNQTENMTALKQTEQDALTLARENGMVHAGKNHPPKGVSLDDGCRLSRVHHATITAMVRKGLLIACHSSDGGYAGMIPSDKTNA